MASHTPERMDASTSMEKQDLDSPVTRTPAVSPRPVPKKDEEDPKPVTESTSTTSISYSIVHNFPKMTNTLVLICIRKYRPDQIPVWIINQASDYLPEFRYFRVKHTYDKIIKSPELACEATLMPIKRFHFDAAILFSNIMLVPEALGMKVNMHPTPKFPEPVTLDNLDTLLKPEGVISRLQYVADTITLTRHKLNGEAVLIGMAGAPWTMMSYMIEGGESEDYSNAKKWLYCHKKPTQKIIDILTYTVADFCIMQARAGAQVIQIFELNTEHINKDMYEEFFIYPLKIIRQRVKAVLRKEGHEEVPMIIYAKGAFHSLDEYGKIGYDVISLDWQTEPIFARAGFLPKNMCLQGNLDPCALFAPQKQLKELVYTMIKKFLGSSFIINLGDAILPNTPLDSVYTFVEAVRNFDKTSSTSLNDESKIVGTFPKHQPSTSSSSSA